MSSFRQTILEITILVVIGAAAIAVLLGVNLTPAHADAKCAAACNAAHDQCLASSHDRYACDGSRNQCLKTCGGG